MVQIFRGRHPDPADCLRPFRSAGRPAVFGLLPLHIDNDGIHLVAEITLIIVLFTDAARIDLRLLRRDHNLPLHMLGFGLPMTVLAGTAAGVLLFPSLSLWEAALLAAILAATDAALGQPVVSNPVVSVRIRQALNFESGLNDGIAPVTHLFLGWFGPRGVASILFVLLVLERSEISNRHTIMTIVIVTVGFSTIAHGVTAAAAARRYGRVADAMGECPEAKDVSEMPSGRGMARPRMPTRARDVSPRAGG